MKKKGKTDNENHPRFNDADPQKTAHDAEMLEQTSLKNHNPHFDKDIASEFIRSLADHLHGVAFCKIEYMDGKPCDAVFLKVNKAHEEKTGLVDISGKRFSEVIPDAKDKFLVFSKAYEEAAQTGAPVSFETFIEPLDKWLSVSIFCVSKDHYIAVLDDVTERKQAEIALIETERNLRRIQEVAKIGYWEWDPHADQIVNSDELLKIFGVDNNFFDGGFGKVIEHLVHPDDRELVMKTGKESVETCSSRTIEYRIVKPNDEIRWVKAVGECIVENGKLKKVIGLNQDITDRKEAELLQKALLERMNRIGRHVPGVIYQFRLYPDGRTCFPYASETAIDHFNISPDEVKEDASKAFALVHPDDLGALLVSMNESAVNLTVWQHEFRLKLKDGSIRWLYGNAKPESEKEGSIAWYGFFTDITERKRIEQELFSVQQINLSIVNSIPIRVFWKDLDLNYLGCNPAFAKDAGLNDPKEIIGKSDFDLVWSDQAELYREDDKYVINTGRSKLNIEEVQTTPQGETIILLTNKIPFHNEQGEIIGILGTYLDITDRKMVELELASKADILERTSQIAKVGGWEYDLRTGKRSWSAETCRILDIDPPVTPKLDKDLDYRFYPDEVIPVIKQRVQHGLKTGEPYDMELPMITSKGRHIWVREQGTFIKENEQVVRVHGVIQDITEKKESELAIQSAQQSYFDIFNSVSEAIYLLDETGTFIDVNKGAEKMYNYTREELIGQSPATVAAPGRNDLEEVMRKTAEVMRTGIPVQFEFWALRKNGEIFPKEVFLNRGRYFGKEVIIATARDITERKELEEKNKQSFIQIRKLTEHIQNIREDEHKKYAREIQDELGQFLTMMKLDASWLSKKLKDEDPAVKDRLTDLTDHLQRMINSVRRIATELRPSVLDEMGLAAAIEFKVREFELRSGIYSDVIVPVSEPGITTIQKNILFMIFEASLDNVHKHSYASRITVSLEQKARYVQLMIIDDGVGFEESKINDKNALGILGMKERALSIGGVYEISGNPDKGTTVLVKIPVAG